jgi:serine/threonine protein phosphatase PrpC
MKESEVSFNAGFLAEAGSKSQYKGYFGSVEKAGLGCWIVAERVDTLEGKDSAKIAVEEIIGRFTQMPTISKVKIKEYLLAAHQKLKDESKFEMLKASLIMVVTDYSKVVWTVVGNVRLYHFREGKFNFRSKDQTIAQLMVDSGLLAEDEVNHREERNNLINYLGGITECKPFISEPFYLQDGDVLLLCNSGLWEKMNSNEITAILGQVGTPRDLVVKLQAAVLAKSGFALKNYTLGAIFAQKVNVDNNRLNFRKIIPGTFSDSALRFGKSVAEIISRQVNKIAGKLKRLAPEATVTLNHPKVHACGAVQNHGCKLPDSKLHSTIPEELPSYIATTEVGTFTLANTHLQLSSTGVTEPETAITDKLLPKPKLPLLRVVKPEGERAGQPAGEKWQHILQWTVGTVLRNIAKRATELWQLVHCGLNKIITKITNKVDGQNAGLILPFRRFSAAFAINFRRIYHINANIKKISVLGLMVLLIVNFGWLFNQRMGVLKIQKEIEAKKQIKIGRERTLAVHEQKGDQLAKGEQYSKAVKEYRLALDSARNLNDQKKIVLLTKKIANTNAIITGDVLMAAGNYQAALTNYLQANTGDAGIKCLSYGINKKIAWTQQMIELLSLEQVGDHEVSCRNYAAARVVYQSARNIASRINAREITAELAAKLAEVNRKVARQTKTSPVIVTRRRSKNY